MFQKDFNPRKVKHTDLAWQDGPYNRYETPPAMIAKYAKMCADGDLNGPLDEAWGILGVEQVMEEYLAHIREWTDKTISARRFGDKDSKEKAHPLFHSDPFGRLRMFADEIRDLKRHEEGESACPTKRQAARIASLISGHRALKEEDRETLNDYCCITDPSSARRSAK